MSNFLNLSETHKNLQKTRKMRLCIVTGTCFSRALLIRRKNETENIYIVHRFYLQPPTVHVELNPIFLL